MKNNNFRMRQIAISSFLLMSGILIALSGRLSAQSDTADIGRLYELDTIRFLNTYQKNINLLHADTLIVQIEGKYYLIPYRVALKSVDIADNTPKQFRITSLALRDHLDFSKMLQNMFNYPRERLYIYHSAKDWRFSEEYDRYFRQYDENRTATITEQTDDGLLGDETTGKTSNIDKIVFPLPATVDIDVNLNKDPGMVTILGVEFNFNKLDPEMKSFLINFTDKRGKSGNKKIID